MSKIRFHSLDSLRGLASLQVVVGHCFMALPALLLFFSSQGISTHAETLNSIYSPIFTLWDPHPAVIVFFVLSGFVLSFPYYNDENKQPNYPKFFIKRILRLYIPCAAIILISLFIGYTLYKPNEVNMFGDWVKELWATKRDFPSLVDLFLLDKKTSVVNLQKFNDIDPPLWTLPIELKLSLILPFFVFLQKRFKTVLGSFVAVLLCAAFFDALKHLKVERFYSDVLIMYYFTFFALGAFLCRYRTPIINWINSISLSKFILLTVAALLIYTFRYTLWWLPAKPLKAITYYRDDVYAIAGSLFIFIALSKRVHAIFNNQIFLFIGKISFSFYLIHAVIIAALAHLLVSVFSPTIIVAIGFVVSIISALGFYYAVELQALHAGKFIAELLVNPFIKNRQDKLAKTITK